MGRLSWLTAFADPVYLGATVAAILIPQLLLPPPLGPSVSVALASGLAWLNLRLDGSIRRLPVQNGPEGLVGGSAEVIEPLGPTGLVRCGGETWKAREVRGQRVEAGRRVRVAGVRRLELQVEKM